MCHRYMETFRKNLNLVIMLVGFAGTFIGIGVGWADIKSTKKSCEENSKQITDIRSNGTELSRRDRENQTTLHQEVNRRIALLEDAVREYAQVRIEIAQTKGEIIEIKDRLGGIVEMLKHVNIVKP